MSMSRKDYVLLAQTLKAAVNEAGPKFGGGALDGAAFAARAVANALERTQTNFDRPRFIAAVGLHDFVTVATR